MTDDLVFIGDQISMSSNLRISLATSISSLCSVSGKRDKTFQLATILVDISSFGVHR